MSDYKEKRRFPRVPVNFVTVEVYSPTGQPESPEMCFVINLSENGMMFRAQRVYEAGQTVLVTFSLPAPEDVVIKTDAKVVHRQDLETSKFFGVQFKNLGLVEHRLVRTYIERALKGES